jgi:hypothetical protein
MNMLATIAAPGKPDARPNDSDTDHAADAAEYNVCQPVHLLPQAARRRRILQAQIRFLETVLARSGLPSTKSPPHDPPHDHSEIDCPACRRELWRGIVEMISSRSRCRQGAKGIGDSPSGVAPSCEGVPCG